MKKIFFGFLVITVVITACKKEDSLGEAPRLFRPVIKDQLESNGNWIRATWQAVKGAVAYKAELSVDTFQTVSFSMTVDTNSVLFENLKWEQLYQVRVRAVAEDTAKNSGLSDLGAIKTARFPTILNVPSISEINDNSVKVSWKTEGAAVTGIKILLASDSSVAADVTLDPADVANAYKIVSGLNAETDYIIMLYSGSTLRGWANFRTKTSFAGSLVDLRGISGRPSVLQDTIPFVASGSVIILKRGETYTITSTVYLDKSLNFIGGTDLLVPEQPVIYMSNNFNITSGSIIDSITFTDITLRGSDFASKYIFNVNQASTIGKIRYESCLMEIFRGITRFQSQPSMLGSFEINNCIVDSVRDYGVINMDVSSAKVSNVMITNSTIYKAYKIVVSSKPTQGSESVLIDNCTISQAPLGGGSAYIVDYSGFTVTNGITVSNCIFGTGYDNAGNLSVRDVRASASTTINASNNYRTADHLSSGNDLPSIITYTRPSNELWADPLNGDFSIVDNTYPGRNNTGDPRWRP